MAPETFLRGWPGLLSAYAAVQAPMLIALARSRAPLLRLVASPLAAAPVTAATGAGMALAAPLLHGLGVGATAATQVIAGASVSMVLGYLAGRALGRGGHAGVVHQRGALVEDAPPVAARALRSPRQRGVQRERITVAGIPLAPQDEVKHFKFIGTTGTGKSTAIHEVLETALRRGDRAVIADPDGGYLKRFYHRERGDVILNPFEPASARWDLFAEINDAYDVEQLARSLIPDHEGPDRSWRGYARTFFSAVTAQAHAAGSRDVRDLYRLLVVAGTQELKTLVAGTPAQPFLEEHNGRMFDSIRSVTASAVGALDYVSRQISAPLSVRQWVRSGAQARAGGVLFLPYRAGQVAALRSTISAWMRLAIFEAMQKEEGDQRLWFVVDELDALGQIDGLKDALARLRKFGGRCVLGFQSIAQVSTTYGHGEAQTLVENCGNSLILRCSGSEHGGTSQFASRLIGEREVLRVSTSRSRRATELLSSVTRAEHVGVESAVMGAEIEQLPDLCGYLKIASQPQWLRVGLRRMSAGCPAVVPSGAVRLALRGPQRSAVPEATVPEATDGLEAGPS
jgi:Type IV secretion-system coupling protein DNA-binding domain